MSICQKSEPRACAIGSGAECANVPPGRMCKRPAEAEPEAERASTKPKPPDAESENDVASNFDTDSFTSWLEDWMKAHVGSSLEEDCNVSTLLEDIRDTVGCLMEDNLQEFVEDLKLDHNVTMPSSSELEERLFDAQVDYLHCAALTKFLSDQYPTNFRNRKRLGEFHERLEESATLDQLQFDVLYDFALFIGQRGGAEEESEDDEEPVEEEESDHSEEEEESDSGGSGGSGGSGSESESDEN